VDNFDLVLNTDHKRKGDGVNSKGGRDWWSKQVTTVRIDSREGGVNSCHAPLSNIRGNGVATRVGNVYIW